MRSHDHELTESAKALRVPPERVADAVGAALPRPRARARRAPPARPTDAVDVDAAGGGRGRAVVRRQRPGRGGPVADGQALLELADRLKGKLGDAAIVLGERRRGPRRPRRQRGPGAGGRGVRAGEIVKIAARRRWAAAAAAATRSPAPVAVTPSIAGRDRGGARGDRGSAVEVADAGAGARLRKCPMRMRGQRPDRRASPRRLSRSAPTHGGGCARLRALVAELGAERVVVGLPLSLSGADSAQTAETRAFAARCSRSGARPGRALRRALHDPPGRAVGRPCQRGLARRRAPARGVAGRPSRRREPPVPDGRRTRRGARGGPAASASAAGPQRHEPRAGSAPPRRRASRPSRSAAAAPSRSAAARAALAAARAGPRYPSRPPCPTVRRTATVRRRRSAASPPGGRRPIRRAPAQSRQLQRRPRPRLAASRPATTTPSPTISSADVTYSRARGRLRGRGGSATCDSRSSRVDAAAIDACRAQSARPSSRQTARRPRARPDIPGFARGAAVVALAARRPRHLVPGRAVQPFRARPTAT